MKKKNNGGFSLVEVLVSMVILATIVIPVCTGFVRSVQINDKAEAMLRARIAVSSAVEQLKAEGITTVAESYDTISGPDRFPGVKVKTSQDAGMTAYYIVEVTDDAELVKVSTCIRAFSSAAQAGGGGG